MLKKIKIELEKANERKEVSILDIINHVRSLDKVHWYIIWLEAVGKRSLEYNLLDYENEINLGRYAKELTLDELALLQSGMQQFIEVQLVGVVHNDSSGRKASKEDILNSALYDIQLIDSSFWEVESNDQTFIQSLLDEPILISKLS